MCRAALPGEIQIARSRKPSIPQGCIPSSATHFMSGIMSSGLASPFSHITGGSVPFSHSFSGSTTNASCMQKKPFSDRSSESLTKIGPSTPRRLFHDSVTGYPQGFPSIRHVLKREYSGFLAIIASFSAIEVVGDAILDGQLEIDMLWAWIFLVSLGIYSVLRFLKKHTAVLSVEGR